MNDMRRNGLIADQVVAGIIGRFSCLEPLAFIQRVDRWLSRNWLGAEREAG